MAGRKKMAGMSTGMTIALVGGGVVLLYLIMSKSSSTTTALPAGTVLQPSQTAAINAASANQQNTINDVSDNVNNLISSIFS
jgi:hypothetical protein